MLVRQGQFFIYLHRYRLPFPRGLLKANVTTGCSTVTVHNYCYTQPVPRRIEIVKRHYINTVILKIGKFFVQNETFFRHDSSLILSQVYHFIMHKSVFYYYFIFLYCLLQKRLISLDFKTIYALFVL